MHAIQLRGRDSFFCETLDLDSITILLVVDRPFCQFALLDALFLSLLFTLEDLIQTHQTQSICGSVCKLAESSLTFVALLKMPCVPAPQAKHRGFLLYLISETEHDQEGSQLPHSPSNTAASHLLIAQLPPK
jgi:hypothetical protein